MNCLTIYMFEESVCLIISIKFKQCHKGKAVHILWERILGYQTLIAWLASLPPSALWIHRCPLFVFFSQLPPLYSHSLEASRIFLVFFFFPPHNDSHGCCYSCYKRQGGEQTGEWAQRSFVNCLWLVLLCLLSVSLSVSGCVSIYNIKYRHINLQFF